MTVTPLASGAAGTEGATQSPAFLERFVSQASVIPQTLMSRCAPSPAACHSGDFDIPALLADIATIKWNGNPYGFLAGSTDGRSGAVYLFNKRTVILNLGRAPIEPIRTMPIAALHEALGGLGYLDENYERSLALYFLSLTEVEQKTIFSTHWPRVKALFEATLTTVPRHNESAILVAGGATSVGGGDGLALQAKANALVFANPICELLHRTCTDIHARLLKAAVEINKDPLDEALRTEIKDGRALYRVPFLTWVNGNIRTKEARLSDEQLRILMDLIAAVDTDEPAHEATR
jgi:hypothetical protein